MKKLKISRLVILIVTIILEALPFGAVLKFAEPDKEPIYQTFSYFRFEPWGYANFGPLIAAVSSCVLLALVVISLSKKIGWKPYNAEIIFSWIALIAAVLPLCSLIYSPFKYIVTGLLIAVLLFANLVLQYMIVKQLSK